MVDFSDKQLDAEDMLPENWRTSMNHSDELYHFGVRKKRDKPSKAQLNNPNARYGAGYSWASPANEALKAIGNKIIVNTVTSR